jgi:hypothetical protein
MEKGSGCDDRPRDDRPKVEYNKTTKSEAAAIYDC